MATFDYVEFPVDAIRLQSSPEDLLSHHVKPARKTVTSLPDMTATAPSTSRRVQFDGVGSSAGGMSSTASAGVVMQSPTKAALSLVPQLLLSASLPGSVPSSSTPTSTPIPNATPNFTPNPKAAPHTLLSTRDPLSVPIITSNFRRFVPKVGPVFWLQDRIEEVILWKKGWKRTVVWFAAYAFLCYFPRMLLLIPHIFLLGVMLAYYPTPGAQPVPINVSEGTVDWQANIQGIQNLMGAFSDVHDAIIPFLPLLVPPASFASSPSPGSTSSSTTAPAHRPSFTIPTSLTPSHVRDSSISPTKSNVTLSTFTSTSSTPHHIPLILTLLSFLILLPLLMANILPLRLLFFLAGAGVVGCGHPLARAWISEMWRWKNAEGIYGIMSSLFTSSSDSASAARMRMRAQSILKNQLDVSARPTSTAAPCPSGRFSIRALAFKSRFFTSTNPSKLIPSKLLSIFLLSSRRLQSTLVHTLTPAKIKIALRRIIDNDRLSDQAWAAPMCTVELWENERWVEDTKSSTGGRRTSIIGRSKSNERERDRDVETEDESYVLTPIASSSSFAVQQQEPSSFASTPTQTEQFMSTGAKLAFQAQAQTQGTWSKLNLRPSERAAWTRGRDGWSGVGGEVSNLTFSLSPGWAFVETEGWRPDLEGRWVYENDGVEGTADHEDARWRCGADKDGWTYSMDTWSQPRSSARPGDGWVTRRRRWVRRVYWKGHDGA